MNPTLPLLRSARLRALLLGTAATALLASVAVPRSFVGQQSGPASAGEGAAKVTREIVLDQELGVVLHLSLLVSTPLMDDETRALGRVASIVGFTTVEDRVQYDIFHASPLLAVDAGESIEISTGFAEEGRSGEFSVEVHPGDGKTWGTLVDVDDLEVTVTRR